MSITTKSDQTYTPQDVDRFRRLGDVTSNGVAFDWDLAGSAGARFTLIREGHHAAADIDEAARELKRDRDVVGKVQVSTMKPRALSETLLPGEVPQSLAA
ncbi:hypothetical protein [Ralstonia pseudosolanacearum]|uniref:hypothetical protein n=1 Tax=Ralstonia pseudosolanacearum TaxID=1310165 RepID=UPI003CEEC487